LFFLIYQAFILSYSGP